MKTLIVNAEISALAKNAIAYTKGLPKHENQKFVSLLFNTINSTSVANSVPAPAKSFITLAKGRFFTVFLQFVEIFYILYK